MAERRVIGPGHTQEVDDDADEMPMVIRMTFDPREFMQVPYEDALGELVDGGWDLHEADEKLKAGLQLRAPESVLLIGDFKSRDGVMRGG